MSGQNESSHLTVKDRLAEFEATIDKFEENLPLIFPNCSVAAIQGALNCTPDDLKMMRDEDCVTNAHVLSQYNLYLQKEINRNNVRIEWAKAQLNNYLAQKYDNYGDKYTKYEIKLALLCKENTHAQSLQAVVRHAEARILSLTNITMHISLICNTLMGLSNSKRRQQYDSARTN